MNSFPDEARFRLPWRTYQQRVIDQLSAHLDDDHLHVVAAPGSGKTVLGLEVARRLNRPTLILAPTVTIRDQWIERFVNLCLADSGTPDYVSTDVRNPGFLTVTTYQALHCACSGSDDDQLPERKTDTGGLTHVGSVLRGRGVRTVVVDEAHHLRTAWWHSLMGVKRALENPTVVALTATPPLDVPESEWQRYRELCGPVDAEISVPELVLEGHLCPHQDYLSVSYPTADEMRRIDIFRADVDAFIDDVTRNEEFVAALESHPWLTYPHRHVEQILDDPDYFTSIAIFVKSVRGRLPEGLADVLGFSPDRLPELNRKWLEVLLRGRLYRDAKTLGEWDPMLRAVRERLERIGASERGQVYLTSSPQLDRLLVRSASKLRSIKDIVDLEHDALGPDLRMVILTDFIRRGDMPGGQHDLKPPSSMGAVPIFETVRRDCASDIKLGILTGSLVVVPLESAEMLRGICERGRIDWKDVTLFPLWHDSRYCRLIIEKQDRNRIVALITELFGAGGINCLVGTKSLLGEGWDAPCVNSLILASFVGSFMLSNQMRGRAIRSDKDTPHKTANVWHLVCVDPRTSEPGADLETLTRRLRAFVGVSFREPVIESGVARLGLGEPPFDRKRLDEVNRTMRRGALDRAGLRARWEEALVLEGGSKRLVEEVRSDPELLPRRAVIEDGRRALAAEPAAAGGALVAASLGAAASVGVRGSGIAAALWLGSLTTAVLGVGLLPGAVRNWLLMRRHGSEELSLRQVGEAVLRGLVAAGAIRAKPESTTVVTSQVLGGGVACTIEGASLRDQSMFLEALRQVLEPPLNPRYLLVQRSGVGRGTGLYRAVPDAVGRRREWADEFLSAWRQLVGGCDLVYTRSVEGRRKLLKAKESGLVSGVSYRTERFSRWR